MQTRPPYGQPPPAGQGQPYYYQTPRMPQPPPVKKGRGLRSVVLVLLLIVIAGVVAQSTLFRLKHVVVSGCVNLTAQEVIERSGLFYGQNLLSINKETIEKSVNADRYLVFQDLTRDYRTGTVTLSVYERVPMCIMQTLGIQYTIDTMGYVLEQTEELSLIDGLIVLTGLKTNSCYLGQRVGALNPDQLRAYQSIMYELNLMDYADQISELNVLDLDNLYLVSKDGMAVRLGDASFMHGKILSLMTVREELEKMGKKNGTIDVSMPVYPVYDDGA